MSEVTSTDPPVFVKGLKNSSLDLRISEEGQGAVQWYPSSSMFVLFCFFFKSSCLNVILSSCLTQALVLSVSSSMKELKRVSSQLWLAMHC